MAKPINTQSQTPPPSKPGTRTGMDTLATTKSRTHHGTHLSFHTYLQATTTPPPPKSTHQMAASGSLRMALGHRAMAKKYNDTQAPVAQPEPVSPEVNSARRGEKEGEGDAMGHGSRHLLCMSTAPGLSLLESTQGRSHVIPVAPHRACVCEVGGTGGSEGARTSVPLYISMYVPRRSRAEVAAWFRPRPFSR
jgi:hypothetical protein